MRSAGIYEAMSQIDTQTDKQENKMFSVPPEDASRTNLSIYHLETISDKTLSIKLE